MSCTRSKWNFHRVLGAVTVALFATLYAGVAEAAIIASDDFESYPSIIGDPDPHFGNAGENGGTGWTTEWDESEVPIASHIRQDLIHGYGKGLEVSNRNSSDTNIVRRSFPAQTEDFYVGFTMRTTMDDPAGNNHLLVHFSDSLADAPTGSYGGGAPRNGAGGPGNFFTRQGNNTTDVISSITQVYGERYNMVLKFSKTGTAADPFDGIEMWINQATEGTPDTVSTTGTVALTELSTFHLWFDPRNLTSPDEGHLALDNLVIATTYDEALSLTLVTGIPEPTSLCLLSLACALCSVAARRVNRRRIA